MPTILANGINIHYAVHGAGEPLILIGGLGSDMHLWIYQIPDLSRRFQVIAFDNRGAGESDKPDEPYTVRAMADDTAALLDALGVGRAHVLGGSMGGFIAQELALSHPGKVDRLVLACTHFGGANYAPIPQETLAVMMNRTGDPETDIRTSFQVYAQPTWRKAHPDVIEEYVAWRVAHPQPVFAYQRQLGATLGFETESRLGQITAPTLIIHGEDDRVVPVENGRLLAARIPHARLVTFPDAGHVFMMEQAQQVNDVVIRFLKGE